MILSVVCEIAYYQALKVVILHLNQSLGIEWLRVGLCCHPLFDY